MNGCRSCTTQTEPCTIFRACRIPTRIAVRRRCQSRVIDIGVGVVHVACTRGQYRRWSWDVHASVFFRIRASGARVVVPLVTAGGEPVIDLTGGRHPSETDSKIDVGRTREDAGCSRLQREGGLREVSRTGVKKIP